MPHARTDAPPPKRKRKPAPKPRPRVVEQQGAPFTHDTPPRAPAPTYGPGRISPPTSTLDAVLAYGAGPLNLPEGKINLPRRPHQVPLPRGFVPRGEGEREHNPPTPLYQSLYGKHGATVVPPRTQAMLEHALGDPHQHDQANYLLSSPDLDTLNQRSEELGLDPSKPLYALVRGVNDSLGSPTHEVAGFPETGRTALPAYVRDILVDRIHHMEREIHGLDYGIDEHSSDADIVRASFGEHHKDSYWDVLRNLPRDLVETPLYAYQGGVALGSAAGYAAHGDFDPLREVAAQQADVVRHPGAFVQQHPFQALLAASGVAKGVGRATARARGVVEEPRIVPTRHPGTTINRGVSPANDYIRGVQGIQDLLTRPHAPGGIADRLGLNRVANRFQDQGLKKNVRQVRARENAVVARENAPFARELADAAGDLTRREQTRVLAHEAQGFTPEELAAFRDAEPGATTPLTPEQQRYLEAASASRGRSEDVMERDLGLLGSGARLHRNVDPLAQVLADQGNPLATRYLEVNQELSDLQQRLAKTPTGDPAVRKLRARLTLLRRQVERDRQTRITELERQIARFDRARQFPPAVVSEQDLAALRHDPAQAELAPPLETPAPLPTPEPEPTPAAPGGWDPFGPEPEIPVETQLGDLRLLERDLAGAVEKGAGTRQVHDLNEVRSEIARLEAEQTGRAAPATPADEQYWRRAARNASYAGKRAAGEFSLRVDDALRKVSANPTVSELIGAVDAYHAALRKRGTGRTRGIQQAEANLVAHLERVNAPDDIITDVLRTRSNSERFRSRFDLLTRRGVASEEPGPTATPSNLAEMLASERNARIQSQDVGKRLARRLERRTSKAPARERAAIVKRLQATRDELVRGEQPFDDITDARIRAVEQRLQDTPTRGMLEGQVGQAFADRNELLNQIVEERAAQGHAAPFRVPLEREQQRQGFFGTRSTGSPAGVKRRGKRQYTGALFRSGEYKPPTHEDFVRDLEAPLDAQGYHRLVNHITNPDGGFAHRITNDGAEDIPIPDDVVVVKPASVEPGREPETFKPGESFASRLDYQTDHVPPGGDVIVVPRSVAKELVRGGEQVDRGRTLDRRISQALRNTLLYSRPAYVTTNLQGNVIQNTLEGVGPVSYIRAMRGVDNRLPLPPGVEEGGAARTNFSPYTTRVREALDADSRAKVVTGLLGAPFAAYTRSLFKAARAVEDATRRAAYYKNAVPAARAIAHADESRVQRFLQSFKGVDDATHRVLEQMADSEGVPGGAVETAAASAVQAMNRVLGDFQALPSNRVFDTLTPFHRWLQFATRLLVVSLPLHYPGKALLLYRLGALGQDLQNQLGPLTPANQGIVPIGGTPDATQVLTTAYPNSFATLADALATDQRGESSLFGLNLRRGVNYLNPFISTIAGDVTGFDPETGRIYTNPRGEGILASDRDHPTDPDAARDYGKFVLAQLLGLVPPLRVFQPTNAADTSIPLPGLTEPQYQPEPPAWAKNLPQAQTPRTTLPLSAWEQIFNQFSPFKVKNLNLRAAAQQGVQQVSDRLAATQRKETR